LAADDELRSRTVKNGRGYLPIAFFFCFVTVVLVWAGQKQFMNSPVSSTSHTRIVIVAPGDSFRTVARRLQQAGLVSDPFRFILWVRLMGLGRKIKAGEYEFRGDMTPQQILDALVRGRGRIIKVTIPEGYAAAAIARLLSKEGITDENQFLELMKDLPYISSLGLEGSTLEGYLFPDTYLFSPHMDAKKVIQVMVSQWRKIFQPYVRRARETGMSVHEVMTLASMVEKETSLKSEKPIIASVFINRLKRNMRLQCDPTVIYGLKEFDGNLTREDLKKDTPYNTYVRRGLPPGPIANPGKDSIHAVLYPASSGYLYFVSKNDGSHKFSRSLSTHRRAVRTYQKKNKE